jgi:3-hydroxyisobutyrate dehydrogenase-like beta-hydroxyacid dehydrogenase
MKIGFVGLGAMGSLMATRLLDSGYGVVTCDTNPAAVAGLTDQGAIGAKSPADVANQCEIVLVSLPTPDVVRAVACGPSGLIEGAAIKTYVDLSTTGAKTAIAVAECLAEKGIVSLDAPVSGGPSGAAAGTLAIMVSGDQARFTMHEAVLRTIGSRTTYVGTEVGQGQSLKLINNLLVASSLASTSEALVMGTKAGLSLDIMLEVLNASSGRSFATEKIFPMTLPGRTFDFGFRTELMYKDIGLCLQEAENMGVPAFLGNNVKQIWSYAMLHGGGSKDFSAILNVFEDWSDVRVGGSEPIK